MVLFDFETVFSPNKSYNRKFSILSRKCLYVRLAIGRLIKIFSRSGFLTRIGKNEMTLEWLKAVR